MLAPELIDIENILDSSIKFLCSRMFQGNLVPHVSVAVFIFASASLKNLGVNMHFT